MGEEFEWPDRTGMFDEDGSLNHARTRADFVPDLASTAENNLSFIETSALDANNVESAFQNILAGSCPSSLVHLPPELVVELILFP